MRGRAANVLLGCAIALLVGACAQSGGNGGVARGGSGDGGLEEVVVTVSRVERGSGRAPNVETAPRDRPSGSAGNAASPSSSAATDSASAEAAALSQGVPLAALAANSAAADKLLAAPAPYYAGPYAGHGGAPLSRVQPGEEVWVIETAAPRRVPAVDAEDDAPGSGTMLALVVLPPRGGEPAPTEPVEVPLPLQHTDVHAVVTGYIGAVDVTKGRAPSAGVGMRATNQQGINALRSIFG